MSQSKPTHKPGRIDVGAVLALVIAALGATLADWQTGRLADWDILTFYLPWYAHMGEALRSLDVPGWNPYIVSGTPFAGDPQSGWWYLPAMILFTIFPPLLAFKISILFHMVLGAIALYVLARLLGFSPFPAFIGGVIFGISQTADISTCCTIFFQLLPWIPVALIGVELGLRAQLWQGRALSCCLTAFALSQMAGAWVGQGMYNAYLVVFAWFLFRGLLYPPHATRSLRSRLQITALNGISSFALGIALAAAGLLPRLDAVRRSHVGSPEYRGETAADIGWEPKFLLEALTRLNPNWFPYYIGGAALVLALIGCADLKDRMELRFFAGLAIVVAILPLQPNPLHRLFFLLPEFRGMHLHDPGRVLILLPVATAMLATAGTSIATSGRYRRWPLSAALFVVLLITLNWNRTWKLLSVTTVGAGILLVAFALSWVAYRRGVEQHKSAWMATIIFLVVLSDPAGFVLQRDLRTAENAQTGIAIEQSASAVDPNGAGEFLQQQIESGEVFRYFGFLGPREGYWFQAHEIYDQPTVLPVLANNRAMRLQLFDIQGYNPANIQRYLDTFFVANGFKRDYHEVLVFRDTIGSPLLRMLNVHYVIVPSDESMYPDEGGPLTIPADFKNVFENDAVIVYRISDGLPRAWVVHDTIEAEDDVAWNAVAAGSIDLKTSAFVSTPIDDIEPLAPGSVDSVRINKYEPDLVQIDVETSSAGLLVLADTWDPGWKVSIDGTTSELVRVNGLIRGVRIPEGAHSVTFSYQPTSLRVGLMVSFTSAALAIALCLAALASRNRKKQL